MNARRSVLLAAAAVLAGCAAPRPPGGPAPRSGRIAVRVDATADQPVRQTSAAFELAGDAARGELRLFTPLGSTLGAARWDSAGAELLTAQGSVRYADLDTLSREVLGEALPLRALPDWIAGRPWDGAPSERLDQGFTQLGWRIDLTRHGDGTLVAVRETAPTVTVRVRLDPSS